MLKAKVNAGIAAGGAQPFLLLYYINNRENKSDAELFLLLFIQHNQISLKILSEHKLLNLVQ
jgi:hypothetical protein